MAAPYGHGTADPAANQHAIASGLRLVRGAAGAPAPVMAQGPLNDPLTGLANRRRLLDCLEAAVNPATQAKATAAVCFIDVDGMTSVNASHGYDAGDRLLQSIAALLSDLVRASDTVARINGDEFVVVLHRLQHLRDAANLTQSLQRRLMRPHRIGAQSIQVTASVGWAFYPHDGRDPLQLLAAADGAMEAVKRSRGGPR